MIFKNVNKKWASSSIFNNVRSFGILYFTLLSIHILLKLTNIDLFITSLISKPWFLISLILFFYINSEDKTSKSFKYMLFGLFAYLVGDTSLIFLENVIFFNLGVVFFIIGKLFYCLRFSNKKEFNVVKIWPYVLLCFCYMFFLMSFIYISLDEYFFPMLLYLFLTMIVGLFAFLRQYEVGRNSFLLVFVGVLFSFVADSVALIQAFYNQILMTRLSMVVMFFYGISQFLIVIGIIREQKKTSGNLKSEEVLK